jgi:hypothetical protein
MIPNTVLTVFGIFFALRDRGSAFAHRRKAPDRTNMLAVI